MLAVSGSKWNAIFFTGSSMANPPANVCRTRIRYFKDSCTNVLVFPASNSRSRQTISIRRPNGRIMCLPDVSLRMLPFSRIPMVLAFVVRWKNGTDRFCSVPSRLHAPILRLTRRTSSTVGHLQTHRMHFQHTASRSLITLTTKIPLKSYIFTV